MNGIQLKTTHNSGVINNLSAKRAHKPAEINERKPQKIQNLSFYTAHKSAVVKM